MSSLIKQNTGSPTPPAAAPATAPSSGSNSTGGGVSFGSFALAGTAAMMAEILKLIQELCTIENEYGELGEQDIQFGCAAAQANAAATLSAGQDQAAATMDQAWQAMGSAISMGASLLCMGVATTRYSGTVSEIDNQSNLNKNVMTNIEAAKADTSEDLVMQTADGQPKPPITTGLSANAKTLAETLESGEFGRQGSRALQGYTDKDYEDAITYIKRDAVSDTPTVAGTSAARLNKIYNFAKDNSTALSGEKDIIMQKRTQQSQLAQTFGQVGSSVSQAASQQDASKQQGAQAKEEADKSYSQFTQQIDQTAQQQVLGARDSKDQQITQTLQMVQSANAANQIN